MTESYYTPGVCNINESEVAYRKKAYYLGLSIGFPLLLVLIIFKSPTYMGVIMFLPIWIGAIGYLQAKYKFCVGYAASGVYSKSAEYAETEKIVEEAKRKLDAKRARKINTQALLIGVLGSALSVGLLTII